MNLLAENILMLAKLCQRRTSRKDRRRSYLPRCLHTAGYSGVFAERLLRLYFMQEKRMHRRNQNDMKELLNVLVADSDTAAAERIRLLLEQNGCFVQTTSDGQKVLAQLTDGRYDLLLLSLALQCLDGYAVLSSLSELRLRRYPFVAVHTAMGEQAARRALSLGADIALLKPCCDAELLSLRQQAENMPSILSRRKAEQVFPDACRLAAAIGVPERMKGFQYLACAVSLCYADDRLFSHATGMLYPRVAEKFGTTPGGVEHAIRQSIESTWTYGSVEPLHAVFGNSVDPQRGKPTNIECIALLAEQLRKIESE